MKRVVELAVLALAAVSVAACGGPVAGQPSATPSGSSSSPAVSPSDSLLVDNPCELLSSSDLATLGVSSPPSVEQLDVPTCEFQTSDYSVGVGIRQATLAQLNNAGPMADVALHSHTAKQVESTQYGGCVVAIQATPSLRVDVSADGNVPDVACPEAVKVAQLVEPHLPPA